MRILEVRDGFIKFESEKRFALSSFVEVRDLEKIYIAQVVQTKRAGEISIVYAKFLFINDGELYPYDLTLPSKNSEIAEFSFEDLSKNFEYKSPVVVGPFCNSYNSLNLEKSCFDKKLLVSIDENQIKQNLIPNIAKQFDKFLIIDTLGIYNGNKYVAGVDFKLPLNSESLQFIFEDCLNDATSDSKNLIKEIFQDLADYSKTVPFLPFGALKTIVDDMVEKSHVFKLLVLKNKLAKFDKLGYFATTIDEAQNLNKILEKNCVIDLSKLDATFQNRYLCVILSSLQKQNIESQLFVEGSNSVSKKNLKALLTGSLKSTLVTNSRFKYLAEIKSMFTNYIISPSFANNSVFKTFGTFLNAMQKDSCLVIGENTNYIPFVSSFENVDEFFNRIQTDSFVELEDSLNNESPVIEEVLVNEEIEEIETLEEKDESILAIEKKSEDLINKVSEEIKNEDNSVELNLFEEENDSEDIEEVEEIEEESLVGISETEDAFVEETLQEESLELHEIIEDDFEEDTISAEESIIEESIEEYHTQVDKIQTIEISEDISELAEEGELIQEEVVELEEVGSEEVLDTQTYSAEVEFTQEPLSIIPISDNTEEFDEIIELDDSDLSEPDIVVEFDDDDIEQLEPEDLDKAIIEDVDKVFTTMKEDSISDSDLDFIDELNGNLEEDSSEEVVLSEGMEELTELQEIDDAEEGFIEPLEEINEKDFNSEVEQKEILETRSSSTPMVPVYEAEIPQEDIVTSDPIEQGDTVVHAKYGNGVVEKMIKYGAKTLYSINFDNVGRRLLDPTLTEIKKF